MGMEGGFNAVPEPVVPDESERVDDVEKAQVMADAEVVSRNNAQRRQEIADGKRDATAWYNPNTFKTEQDVRNYEAQNASELREIAEKKGEQAGVKFDEERKAQLDEVKKKLGME